MRKNKGFTLIELMVVVFIIAILGALAIPQYTKSVETSKADDAISTLQQVGAANRQFALDYPQYNTGQLTSSCSGSCACDGTTCTSYTACNLILCKYLAIGNFDSKGYDFYACNGASSTSDQCSLGQTGTFAACAKRKNGAKPGTTSSPYKDWGYTIDIKSDVKGYPTTDGPPSPPS
ncbi:MAG: prepilin-type N-terminal cleavage/methylation domain-containing protein [Elusimicrobia bacterium]|nr:prepilin-type N-terminal cleavage/methylation domain-containing protein [Elusimicrobiota bacterium]